MSIIISEKCILPQKPWCR